MRVEQAWQIASVVVGSLDWCAHYNSTKRLLFSAEAHEEEQEEEENQEQGAAAAEGQAAEGSL